jgi:translation initiation factor IF-2
MVQLVYALEEKTADEKGVLRAAVVESTKDARVGPVASVIVESGTLRLKDEIVVGGATGRVRMLYDDRKQSIRECLPGCPALVVGFPLVLPVGSIITRKGEAQDVSTVLPKEVPQNAPTGAVLEDEESTPLRVLLKADAVGTLAALAASIPTPSTVVYQSVGDIALADVLLAETTKAFIVGFRVNIPKEVAELAQEHRVTILSNDIIYALNEQLTTLIKRPVPQETELGRATVRQIFHVRDQQIAGCHVESGRLSVNDTIHLIRAADSIDAVIRNLKQKNVDVTSIPAGQDCGVLLTTVSGQPLNIGERSAIIAFQKSV